MRTTLDRKWTETEILDARKIIKAVDRGNGRLVGTLSVCRELHWGYTRKSREKVYDLMPLAALLTPTMLPGKALVIERDRTYIVTDDPRRSLDAALPRIAKGHTIFTRVLSELEPLRGSSELHDIVALQAITSVVNALDPAVWDAIFVAVERGREAE